jgi:nuclear pore complex protein Nup155
VAELQSLLARTIEGVSFFLLLIDHRIGELIGQWVSSFGLIGCLTDEFNRTDAATQKIIASMTFEELITGQNGVVTSRALVNVIIDQQIGQQIAVSSIPQPGPSSLPHAYTRSIPSVTFYKRAAAHFAVRTT